MLRGPGEVENLLHPSCEGIGAADSGAPSDLGRLYANGWVLSVCDVLVALTEPYGTLTRLASGEETLAVWSRCLEGRRLVSDPRARGWVGEVDAFAGRFTLTAPGVTGLLCGPLSWTAAWAGPARTSSRVSRQTMSWSGQHWEPRVSRRRAGRGRRGGLPFAVRDHVRGYVEHVLTHENTAALENGEGVVSPADTDPRLQVAGEALRTMLDVRASRP